WAHRPHEAPSPGASTPIHSPRRIEGPERPGPKRRASAIASSCHPDPCNVGADDLFPKEQKLESGEHEEGPKGEPRLPDPLAGLFCERILGDLFLGLRALLRGHLIELCLDGLSLGFHGLR